MRTRPIFIGGCERSGTTMLGAILGAHHEGLCIPEANFIVQFFAGEEKDLNHVDIRKAIEKTNKHPKFKLWGLDLTRISPPFPHQYATYSEFVKWVVHEYGRKQGNHEFSFWVDHTPSNIKNCQTLFSIYPEAKMIHLVRDGRAVANSLMQVNWGPSSVDEAAKFWLIRLAHGFAAEEMFGKEKVLRIKYEDILLDPQNTVSEICEFVGIQFEETMLKGDGFKPPVLTEKEHYLVGNPPDPERAFAWKDQLSERQIEIFEYFAGNVTMALEYPTIYDANARRMSGWENFKSILWKFKWFLFLPVLRFRRFRLGFGRD